MVNEAIEYIVLAVSGCLEMFRQLLVATGTTELWIAGIMFFVVMSVLILPLRGGHAIGPSGFAGFLANKVNRHRKTDKDD